ncbi:serpin family protein [Saccharibacillus sacchari]|uniref:serpin family protein n=1 Tax=Saccharibacillus sacchari TaxID=456493 RepID=UPI0004B4FBDE|nr:serpin family protein [Saccharibacillus sacchari]
MKQQTNPLESLVQSVNALGIGLFGKLNASQDEPESSSLRNRMISPASIGFALSMLREGALDETAVEMDGVLGSVLDENASLGSLQQNLRERLSSADPSVQLEIANALWSQVGHPVSETYQEALRVHYGAESREINFREPAAADIINRWVSDSTHGKIDQLVDGGTLSGLSSYLANAVYFKGMWSEPFNPSQTTDRPFFSSESEGGKSVDVPTMKQSGRYAYLDAEGFRAVRLPYGEARAFDMLLALPDSGRTLQDFHAEQLPRWTEWNERFASARGTVELPKFKLETSLRLNEALMGLGIQKAFDPLEFDFGGMGQGNGQPIGAIAHKTFIEVDEEGTEAAAVTGIARAGAAFPPEEPFELKLNRPFFFAITDRTTGLIVFMGEVGNPLEF